MTYVEPLLLFFVLLAICGLVFRRRAGLSRWLVRIGLAGVLLASFPPVAWLAGLPLEQRYPATLPDLQGAGAIVVLGSDLLQPTPWHPEPVPEWDSFQRVNHAALLHRRYPSLPVLVSGGAQDATTVPVAASLQRYLADQQIAPELIWVEDKSKSTFENALRSVEMLRARKIRRVALVTHACHMLRAESCFRRMGIEVIPAPCAFTILPVDFFNLLPGWRGLQSSERILHEYLGVAWYALNGRM